MLSPWHFLLVVVIGLVFALTVIIDLEVVAVIFLVVRSCVSEIDISLLKMRAGSPKAALNFKCAVQRLFTGYVMCRACLI